MGRQGLHLRGDGPHNDLDSNFYQLLLLRTEDFQGINVFIEKKQMKYTSHEIQNELLSIMSLQDIREIASQIQSAPYFTVMIDKATVLTNVEQVVLVICSVNDNLTVTEDFIGLYKNESIESSSLVSIIKDVLLRMNLKLKYCREQCYDGASNMTGLRNGVAKQLTDEEPRAIFTHC